MKQKTQTKIKYFIYARKSSESEDRQVASVESQINELSKIAKREKLNVINILSESQSAKAPGRPVFNQMLQKISDNEAQGILCWKLNRLARNPIDGGNINWMLQQGIIKHVRTNDRNYFPTDNVLMMNVEFGMANQFILDLSTDVKRGLRNKVKMGWLPGVAPPGYLNNKIKEKGKKDIIKDPERFDMIKKIWELMLKGTYTPPQILKTVNEKWKYKTLKRKTLGGKSLPRSSIYEILTNPFYYGWFWYNKELYEGKHEPMISEDDFNKVQILLGRKGKPRPKKHNLLFAGLMRCGECGAMITGDEKNQIICSKCKHKFSSNNRNECPQCKTTIEKMNNPTILHYIYYHCTKRKNPDCSQGSIEIKELNKQFDQQLSKIEIDDDYKRLAIEHLNKIHKIEHKTRNVILASQQKAFKNASDKLDKLLEMRLNEEINKKEYKIHESRLTKEKNQCQKLLKGVDQRQNKWLELSERTFNYACYARYWFKYGDPELKRQIFATLGSNPIIKDRELIIKARKPFKTIEDAIELDPKVKPMFEPAKNGLDKRKRRANTLPNPSWLCG